MSGSQDKPPHRQVRGGGVAVHVLAAVAVLASLLAAAAPARPAAAEPIANQPFLRTWERTDKPVADGAATRTWIWGPEPFTGQLEEDYAESPGGTRIVQYFDKSRMEVTNPGGDQNSIWYVTNGLLVMELVTGRMQVGDNEFINRGAAQVNVAGDPDDTTGPTYASFSNLLDVTAGHALEQITQLLNRDGTISIDESKAAYNVGTVQFVSETQHWIAAPFWSFMTQTAPVYANGAINEEPLFVSPYYATGYPIAEPYWANVKVGGQQRDVLAQCFERRCLTWTPDNPAAWQVEMGNVGQHYYAWRYPEAPDGPNATANALAAGVANATTADARYNALLDVFDAIGIGVYNADGTQVLGGAERGAGDFYLYDLEVQLMVAALGRDDVIGVDDIARMLTEMGVLENGGTVDPELLRQVLITGAQESQAAPHDADALIPLLVRQLGLMQAQPYDLFVSTALEDITLDPLQSFLIFSALTLPIVQEHGPIDVGATQIEATTNGVLKMTPVAESDHACDAAVGVGWKETWSGTKWFLGFVKVIGSAAKTALVAIDAIHGSVLAYSILVSTPDEVLRTHYGHDGEGQQLDFRLKIEMVDELPESIVKCGWLLGVEFPKKGPIRDVSVAWVDNGLDKHGRIVCEDPCKKTNEQGIATRTFIPKAEDNPGQGWLIEERGQVDGIAMYQSKHKNALGSINQIITPKTATTVWLVEYHQAPAYTVHIDLEYNADFMTEYPEGDDWFNNGSGEAHYTVTIPYQRVAYPIELGDIWYTANGEGEYYTEQAFECAGYWRGGWVDIVNDFELADFPEAPGEMSRWVRIGGGTLQAPISLYRGQGCSTGADPFPMYYGALSSAPMFDLLASGTQTFVVTSNTLCSARGTEIFTSCEATATWKIRVESFAQPT